MGWPNLPLRRRTAPASVTTNATLEDGGMERSRSVGGELGRFFKDIRAAPDRGKSFYQAERNRQHLASLVEAGRHAGRSRVEYTGRNITYHLFTKDFFISVINQKTSIILTATAVVYLFIFFFFSIWWYLIVRFYPGCLYGATTYVEAFTFAIVTHMTIGYGNTGPQQCWAAAWVLATQMIVAVLLEAIVIGIVFARISHPKQRSRSIFISDSSIIARRDGILKFMFRVADVRRTQVVDPKIKAFMYTWGEGRVTAEGERIPVRCEQLDIGYIDGMLLLPLIIEHTIDERSPLCGHTHDSLMAMNAEIVVTFEGTTEFGNPFMARRSYLPTEVHWGHQFAQIVMKPDGEDTNYHIDLNKFHDVVPQDGLPMLPPSTLSQLVVNRAKRTVPYPLLGENTLVLSDVCVIAPNEDGVPCLMCRAADTYPNQMLEILVRMYLYRWHKPAVPGGPVYSQISLECGYDTGEDRLHLRLPMFVAHKITDESPIAHWLKAGGMMEDADSEIVVVINSYLHVTGQNRLRQRTYSVHNHVKYGYRFKNIVKHPAESRDRKPRVRWAHFHDIEPLPEVLQGDGPGQLPPRQEIGLKPVPSAPSLASMYAKLPSLAPESHGALRSVEQRQQMWSQSDSTELTRGNTASSSGEPTASTSCPAPGAGPSRQLGTIWQGTAEPFTGSVPSVAAGMGAGLAAGAAAGMGAGARMYQPSAEEAKNDYTVLPIDLSRYAATAGNEGDSIPLPPPARRSPLPTNFSQQLSAARRHQDEVEAGKAAPFLLFPEVASYALETTDAGDSMPHPQALHPTLPREWVDINERSDFTVMPMDLSRYVAQLSRSETLNRREGPVTLGEASELMAEAAQTMAAAAQQPQQAQQGTPSPPQAQQPAAAAAAVGRPLGKIGPRRPSLGDIKAAVEAATAAEAAGQPSRGSTTDASGYVTPASALGAGSPGPASAAGLPGSAAASPLAGPSAGQAAAAAALAASAALASAEQEAQAEEEQLEEEEQQQQQQQQPLRMQRPPRPPPAGPQAGLDSRGPGSGRLAADAAAAARPPLQQVQQQGQQGQQQQAQEGDEEEHWSLDPSSSTGRSSSSAQQQQGLQQQQQAQQQGRPLDEQELEQLEQRLSRATSSWAIHEQEPESDEEKEGAGPIHFAKQESWQRERALKNLFAPGSPENEPAEGGGGGSGGSGGGGSPETEEQQ